MLQFSALKLLLGLWPVNSEGLLKTNCWHTILI